VVHIRSQDVMSSATMPTGNCVHFVRPELILEAATSVENYWANDGPPSRKGAHGCTWYNQEATPPLPPGCLVVPFGVEHLTSKRNEKNNNRTIGEVQCDIVNLRKVQ